MAGTTQQQPGGGGISKEEQQQWVINYSRYFYFPRGRGLQSSSCPGLKQLTNRCKRDDPNGMWLSASSLATLQLLHAHHSTYPAPVLLVILHGKIYEEHYISKIVFSWPQVSCLDECPIRGSRVVFASFRDRLGQVQKFALRFAGSSDSLAFITSLKESLKDTRNFGLTTTKYGLGASTPSELFSSNMTGDSPAEELSNVDLAGNCGRAMQPSLKYEFMQHANFDETTLVNSTGAECAGLPASFIALLSDSCPGAEQDPQRAPDAVYPKFQMHSVDWHASNQERKRGITFFAFLMPLLLFPFHFFLVQQGLSNPSFYAMLAELEMVISELGGDLAL